METMITLGVATAITLHLALLALLTFSLFRLVAALSKSPDQTDAVSVAPSQRLPVGRMEFDEEALAHYLEKRFELQGKANKNPYEDFDLYRRETGRYSGK